ncbi:hypothetical protein HYT26_02065 [Candidatus Pacearchaeota archaeon]|nr:hypothetical protein [Candidatus Pacearchaeota archaeon]
MIIYSFLSALSEKFAIKDINSFIVNLIFAILIFVIGIFLAKFITFLIKRTIKRASMERVTTASFIRLFLSVVEWSIYLLFLSFALDQLRIPELTSWLTTILVVIPALVGASILIVVGFAVAVYVRDIIAESEIVGWNVLSMIFFYFILYVFMIFALKTALISFDKDIVNKLLLIFTTIITLGITYWTVKKKAK